MVSKSKGSGVSKLFAIPAHGRVRFWRFGRSSSLGRLRLGSVEVDGDRSVTNSDGDSLVRIGGGIAFPMNDALGDEAEVAGRDLDPLPPARTEVDEEPPADAVGIRVMAGMDVPAGGLVRAVLDAPNPDVFVGERFEALDARCRLRGSTEFVLRHQDRSIHQPPFMRILRVPD